MDKIVFKNYMSDGPGYTGTVVINVEGQTLKMATNSPDQMIAWLDKPLPEIASVEEFPIDLLPELFHSLDDSDLSYISEHEKFDTRRLKKLNFQNGKTGAAVLWGECCYASFYILEQGKICNAEFISSRKQA